MPKIRRAIFALAVGCAATGTSTTTTPPAPPSIASSPTDRTIEGLAPTALSHGDTKPLDTAIESYFAASQTKRAYIMTDKPLYQPGETIWFRADLRATGTLLGGPPIGTSMQLVSPRGAVVAQKRMLVQNGVARNDFELSAELEGGEYTLQLAADNGTTDAKKIIVSTYEPPRLNKTLEFVRKAYGEGDTVSAAIEIKRATGEAFGERALTAVVTLDDIELQRIPVKTDRDGKAFAKFALPARIARGDGLLTILAEDGGVTESIQKRIPIVMKTIQFGLYPEGGDLVDDVPGRVYFMAKTTIGKPADIEGNVIDDRNRIVASFASIHDGMGRFELVPQPDRRYHVEITKPVGITAKFDVPASKPGGCVVRSVDQKSADTLRFAAICNTARSIVAEAVQREKRIGSAAFEVAAGKPTLVELPVDSKAPGVVRLTLFNARQEPLAERLVYHGFGADLKITMTADRKSYSPRDPVTLHVHATDGNGKPVKASLGVAVADETVLTMADDKSARVLAHVLLEQELGATAADPIEEPNYYFGDKPDAAAALDALLATRGYRRFEWRPVLPQGGVQ
jgi:hypothetical protein